MKTFVLAALVSSLILAGCGEPTFTYNPISEVPQAVNDLGQLIGQMQRNVVTPGGTEYAPGFSSNDQVAFDSSSRLADIVRDVTGSPTFKAGVDAIQALPTEKQALVLAKYLTPIYPTWAMNGQISDSGTTNAGYWVEQEIAAALTDAVKKALTGEVKNSI